MTDSCRPYSLIYQIFPDRFCIGKNASAAEKAENGLYPDGAIIKKWHELPDDSGNRSIQHFGGDLWGIAEKADYIASLGVDAVYITPIHEAPSYHRYDATDYRSVDKALGGMEAFDAMVEALHKRGIRIIMDLVLNHVSSRHPFFIDALSSPTSRYRSWFLFSSDGSYSSWWGNVRLPELNLENEEVLNEFITGENSVLRFWADKGIDCFRLDCANDLGIKISRLVTETAKKINPRIHVTGETFHYGVPWLEGLDSIQSYVFTSSILAMLHGDISPRQFGLTVSHADAEAGKHGSLHSSWSMLSSHDFPRPMTTLGGDLAKLRLAILLQFTIPGVPMIYYGDEVGMSGGQDPLNRAPMIWDTKRHNAQVQGWYAKISNIRKTRREFSKGNFLDLSERLENGAAGFLRTDPGDPRNYSIVFVNPSHSRKKFTVYVPAAHMFSDLELVDLLSDTRVRSSCGSIHIDLPAMSGAVYVPDFGCKKGYTFSKRL